MASDPIARSENQQEAIVALDRVHKRFGETVALKDVSIDIRRGEFLTLLGPSGCGKTTTLRLISGFETPDGGTVTIKGRRVNDVPPFRRDVNTVFQNYALFPHLTVFDNVSYGLTVKRLNSPEIRTRVDRMLDRVGLSDKARRYPRELSGGQMQRVALARALINEPSVLLLDEPLGALDAKLRSDMQLELRRMHLDLGLTFVCVTHDQEEALAMSDRIAVMQDGLVAQLGTPQQIFETPVNRFVADFIGGCNFLAAQVDANGGLNLPGGERWAAGVRGSARAVTIAVRPQKVGMSRGGDNAGVFRLNAILRDMVYLGNSRRLVLRLADGSEFAAELSEGALAGSDIAAGSAVDLSIDPGDVIIFETPERGVDERG